MRESGPVGVRQIVDRYTIPLAGMGLLILLGGTVSARSRHGVERLPKRSEKVPDRWYRWHPQSTPGRTTGAGIIAFFVSCIASFIVAFRIGVYSYLLWWFGPVRVWRDGLRVSDTPKGRPWIISNGEQIPNGEWFAFLVSLPVVVVLICLLLALMARFSPWKLQAPLDEMECADRERAKISGDRALVIAGALLLLASLALLLVITIRS